MLTTVCASSDLFLCALPTRDLRHPFSHGRHPALRDLENAEARGWYEHEQWGFYRTWREPSSEPSPQIKPTHVF
jgi:hypothetical protein